MNDFNAIESKFASFLKEEAELDTITLPPLRAVPTPARADRFRHKNTVAGLAILAVAASAIGFVVLRDPGERTAKVSVANNGKSNTSSTNGDPVAKEVIAGEHEYLLANLDGQLAIIDRAGKLRAEINTPGKVRSISIPSVGGELPRIGINTPDVCSDPPTKEPYGIYELDLGNHSMTSLVDLDVKRSGQHLSFSADGHLAQFMYDANPIQDCAFFGLYWLEDGSSKKIELPEPWERGYQVRFQTDGSIRLDPAMESSVPKKCAVTIPYDEVSKAGSNLEPLFTRFLATASPMDNVRMAEDLEYSNQCNGVTNSETPKVSGEYIDRVRPNSGGDWQSIHLELVDAADNRTQLTEDLPIGNVDAQFIPAGTNIGVLN